MHTGLKDKKAFVAIVNYGKIIPAKDLDKIFDKFYRVENSRSLKTGGDRTWAGNSKEHYQPS